MTKKCNSEVRSSSIDRPTSADLIDRRVRPRRAPSRPPPRARSLGKHGRSHGLGQLAQFSSDAVSPTSEPHKRNATGKRGSSSGSRKPSRRRPSRSPRSSYQASSPAPPPSLRSRPPGRCVVPPTQQVREARSQSDRPRARCWRDQQARCPANCASRPLACGNSNPVLIGARARERRPKADRAWCAGPQLAGGASRWTLCSLPAGPAGPFPRKLRLPSPCIR